MAKKIPAKPAAKGKTSQKPERVTSKSRSVAPPAPSEAAADDEWPFLPTKPIPKLNKACTEKVCLRAGMGAVAVSKLQQITSDKSFRSKLAKAEAARAVLWQKWKGRKGVVGLGIGFETDNQGQPTGKLAIHLILEKKLPLGTKALRANQVFPTKEAGHRIHIHEATCKPAVLDGGEAIYADSPSDKGTIGLLVKHLGKPVYLTAAHVALGSSSPGTVVAKDIHDAGNNVIGTTLPDTIHYSNGDSVDAVLINPNGLVPSTTSPKILGFGGYPRAVIEPIQWGDRVRMFSRKANTVTFGGVSHMNVSVNFKNGAQLNGLSLVTTDPGGVQFAQLGDSGSVVVNDLGSVVGMLIGLADNTDNSGIPFSIISPADRAAQLCGFSIYVLQ